MNCELDLDAINVEPLSISELLEFTGNDPSDLAGLLNIKLTYGEALGSIELRDAILGLFDRQSRDNVVVTHGTRGANAVVHQALVNPGDRVISFVPAYHRQHSIPASIGADVQFLHLREENNWLPDLSELADLAIPGTKLIALSNPNNPTGSLIERDMLEEIAAIARACNAWVLCDEAFRGSDQDGPGTTASIADIYEKGISTGSLTVVYSLAGLRAGWIVAPTLVIEDVIVHRDSEMISIGSVNDFLAVHALRHHDRLLERARSITRSNIPTLADCIAQEKCLSWVRPRGGTVCLVKVDVPMRSQEFGLALLEETGVLLTPGSLLGVEGYVRIGFGINRGVLTEALKRMSGFLERF